MFINGIFMQFKSLFFLENIRFFQNTFLVFSKNESGNTVILYLEIKTWLLVAYSVYFVKFLVLTNYKWNNKNTVVIQMSHWYV